MALITRPFADIYEELVAYQPSPTEQRVQFVRDELDAREGIMQAENSAFQDMLHIAGVWIGDKKRREKGLLPTMDKKAMDLYLRQREIWTPTRPPRMPEGCRLGFPKAAVMELCMEETELRQWLRAVEEKLRSHIEEACQESYYVMTCVDTMNKNELRGRERIEREEAEAFAKIRKGLFLAAPADYFRKKVIERYGVTRRPGVKLPSDMTVEELETYQRGLLEEEEQKGRATTHDYLVGCYDQLIFTLFHTEIFARDELTESYADTLYPLLCRCSREDFGYTYYHTPAVFLHMGGTDSSYMAQMCKVHARYSVRKGAAFLGLPDPSPSEEDEEEVIVEEEPEAGTAEGLESEPESEPVPFDPGEMMESAVERGEEHSMPLEGSAVVPSINNSKIAEEARPVPKRPLRMMFGTEEWVPSIQEHAKLVQEAQAYKSGGGKKN